eukprot:scaffold257973_cov31-Tisochrysis_lutea.AAC.3
MESYSRRRIRVRVVATGGFEVEVKAVGPGNPIVKRDVQTVAGHREAPVGCGSHPLQQNHSSLIVHANVTPTLPRNGPAAFATTGLGSRVKGQSSHGVDKPNHLARLEVDPGEKVVAQLL